MELKGLGRVGSRLNVDYQEQLFRFRGVNGIASRIWGYALGLRSYLNPKSI